LRREGVAVKTRHSVASCPFGRSVGEAYTEPDAVRNRINVYEFCRFVEGECRDLVDDGDGFGE
jgi:hypothetical protein